MCVVRVYMCTICVCMCYVICVCECMWVWMCACVAYVHTCVCACACVLQYKPLTYRITNLMKTHLSSSQLKLAVDRYNQIGWYVGTYLHMYTHTQVCTYTHVLYFLQHKRTRIILYMLCLHILSFTSGRRPISQSCAVTNW